MSQKTIRLHPEVNTAYMCIHDFVFYPKINPTIPCFTTQSHQRPMKYHKTCPELVSECKARFSVFCCMFHKDIVKCMQYKTKCDSYRYRRKKGIMRKQKRETCFCINDVVV